MPTTTPFIFDTFLQAYLTQALGFTTYPLYQPRSASLPCLTYQGSIDRSSTLGGTSGIVKASYVFNAWANSNLETLTISRNLFTVLDSFQGDVTIGDVSASIQAAHSIHEESLYNPPETSSGRGVYQRACTYEIWYIEPKSNNTAQ